ncbi:MAG: hypothetical protein U1D55_06135 [Phycisphaerae bacterium]
MSIRPWENEQEREADARFPTGRWAGWWRQHRARGRMQLDLMFASGRVVGDGRDWVGDFVISGGYDAKSGRVWIRKAYLGRHELDYDGAASADGIRGNWRLCPLPDGGVDSGPFRIWPIGAASADQLRESAAISV